jgi:hypothetical protein
LANAQGAIAVGASNITGVAGARATGIGSIAIGSGDATVAGASATGADSLVFGRNSTSSIIQGIAIGSFAAATTGAQAIAIGAGVSATTAPIASAQGAIAIGATNGTTAARASNICAVAIGSGNASWQAAAASGFAAVALGHRSAAAGDSGTALGNSTVASGSAATALGWLSSAAHASATAIGQSATTTAANQIMMGTATEQVYIPGTLRIPTGGTAGYFLTSDANGVASWGAVSVSPGAIQSKTTTYTALSSDAVVLADATSGGFTITLPAVSAGRTLIVKRVDTISANIVTVVPASGTIDGSASDTLNAQWQSRTYVSSASAWYKV